MRFENILRSPEPLINYLRIEKTINISPCYDIVLSCVVNELYDSNIIIITEDRRTVENLKRSLKDSLTNPEFGLYPYEIDFVEKGVIQSKIKFLKEFYSPGRKVVISSLKGLFDPVLNKERLTEIAIKKNAVLPIKKLAETLATFGYRREKEILDRGDFSIKGSIVDIYSFSYDSPIRVFYGFEDEIEEVKFFNIQDFRTFESIDEITIHPNSFYLFNEEEFKQFEEKILEKTEQSKNEYLKDTILEDLKEIKSRGNFGTNYYFKYIKKGVLFDFPTIMDETQDFVKIFVDPINIPGFIEETEEIFKSALQTNEILPENVKKVSQAVEKYKRGKIINLRGVQSENTIDLGLSQIPENFTFLTSIKDFVLSTLSEKSVIFATTQRDRVKEILDLYEITYSERLTNNKGVFVLEGFYSQGVESDRVIVLTDRELFIHFEPVKGKPKIISSKAITTPEELENGDLVVHNDFGIGIFRGLVKLDNNGTKEYIQIEYRDGEKLYVPLERIGFVEKYIGDRRLISLNRLSGNDWKNTKEKAKDSAKLLARKLLLIEAERRIKGGFSFRPFQREEKILALSFPYELTEDQVKALDEVLEDMENPKPMDRLICGDVGYGKTEIAVRASLRAVLNGKQVAILVPTTILALQHERTFRERLRFFPAEIAALSRLTERRLEEEIVTKLKNGNLDIVIGTHRILSKDVRFKDLGLLIVDEEQKFGVKDKERIKELRANLDVLTLTATPIPRTLHSALLSLKPVSLISTPPPGRIPVRTFAFPYNQEIMKNAIENELKRGGQIFVVHNRIEDISSFANKVQILVPGAKIGVAHGKMKKDEIEEIMYLFYEGKIDILVSTTIIENGLDIPTVNTLIVNGAENFGLSQMYQLRGRIGRSHINAFAYFFYSDKTSLRAIAEERLETIKEFSGEGAGIKIAMKDLEIRGAGNLLGREQHGHLISVGYNMYVSLLEEATAELKGEKETETREVRVALNENYYIPEEYIELNSERIAYYRRITTARRFEDLEKIREELIDRFGESPREVENLIAVGIIMRLSKDLGIKEIFQEGKRVFFTIDSKNSITINGIEKVLKEMETSRFGKDYISFEVKASPLWEVQKVLNLLSEGTYAEMDN